VIRRTLWAAALLGLGSTMPAHAQSDEASDEATEEAPPAPAMTGEKPALEKPTASPSLSSGQEEEAKRLYSSGAELYEEGNYELAIKAFREAYEISKRHPLLMNVANAQERLGDLQGAIDSLNEYRIYADLETKEKLERRIRVLEQRQDEAGPATAATPMPAETGPQMEPNPVKWVVLGTGGAIAAGFGVVTFVSYSNGQSAVDANDEAAYNSARSLNTIAGALTGVGGALMVVGLALPAERAVSVSPMANGVRFGLRF